MLLWILIVIVIVAAFYAQELPSWVQTLKALCNKSKNVAVEKIEDIKSKTQKKDK